MVEKSENYDLIQKEKAKKKATKNNKKANMGILYDFIRDINHERVKRKMMHQIPLNQETTGNKARCKRCKTQILKRTKTENLEPYVGLFVIHHTSD